jgi:2-haloacid dehalogenase
MSLKALLFDVFGTIVDWRTSIAREGEKFGRANGITGIDWTAFADDWRALYQPSMEQVRSGKSPWTALDDLHRASLNKLLADRGISGISEPAVDHFNRAWHRLDPWPDVVSGLTRLKRKYIIATCSNGNVALMVNLAKYAGLPWDAILGAEPALQYKPTPVVYDKSVALLRLDPSECVMVAAHNSDLQAAAKCGLQCAFIPRPLEFGPKGNPELSPTDNWQLVAKDLNDLAEQLGRRPDF